MTHVTAKQLSEDATSVIERVATEGERIVVRKNRKPVAALVPIKEYEAFRRWEDRMDAEAFRRARKEFVESGEEAIPYEVIRKELRLA